MAKNIVFCADGTWNSPDQDENRDGQPDQTNVYKLFRALKGAISSTGLADDGEQEKVLVENGQTRQVAKYIHGVGDSSNPILKIMGGATGAGTISRIVRGYTYISRHHEEGDSIFVVGFSRGAYTARALAGLIASEGLLKGIRYDSPQARENAYRRAAQVWYRYRSAQQGGSYLQKLAEAAANLPGFLSRNDIRPEDLRPVKSIAAVAVWDTVGAMGIPDIFGDGAKRDAFRFTNNRLSPKVAQGLHAVALDERRAAFLPTLWDTAGNVEQVIFPGAHADVGGGYPESGLSDIALAWMMKRLAAQNLLFDRIVLNPNCGDVAHKPWLSPLFKDPSKQQARTFAEGSMIVDPSVQGRRSLPAVKADPTEAARKYAPTNLPLARELAAH